MASRSVLATCATAILLCGCAGQERDLTAAMRVRAITEQLTARADAASAEADPAVRRARLSHVYASWSQLPPLLAKLCLAERGKGSAAEIEGLARRVDRAIENPPGSTSPPPAWALEDGTTVVGDGLRESVVAANYRWRIRAMLPARFED